MYATSADKHSGRYFSFEKGQLQPQLSIYPDTTETSRRMNLCWVLYEDPVKHAAPVDDSVVERIRDHQAYRAVTSFATTEECLRFDETETRPKTYREAYDYLQESLMPCLFGVPNRKEGEDPSWGPLQRPPLRRRLFAEEKETTSTPLFPLSPPVDPKDVESDDCCDFDLAEILAPPPTAGSPEVVFVYEEKAYAKGEESLLKDLLEEAIVIDDTPLALPANKSPGGTNYSGWCTETQEQEREELRFEDTVDLTCDETMPTEDELRLEQLGKVATDMEDECRRLSRVYRAAKRAVAAQKAVMLKANNHARTWTFGGACEREERLAVLLVREKKAWERLDSAYDSHAAVKRACEAWDERLACGREQQSLASCLAAAKKKWGEVSSTSASLVPGVQYVDCSP